MFSICLTLSAPLGLGTHKHVVWAWDQRKREVYILVVGKGFGDGV